MKKIVICAVLFAAMAAYSESGVNAMPKQTTVQTADSEDGWECIGYVNIYNSNGRYEDSKEAYVKAIGGYLFYRLRNANEYWNVSPNPQYNPNGTSFVSKCKYIACGYYIKNI